MEEITGLALRQEDPLAFIKTHSWELAEHWALEVAVTRDVRGEDLATSLPLIISSTPGIINSLATSLLHEHKGLVALSGLQEFAKEFGLSRCQLGWPVESVVEDLSRLRQSLSLQLEESHWRSLGLLFDRLIAAGVGSYHQVSVQDLCRWPYSDSISGLASASHLGKALRLEVARAKRYRQPVALVAFDLDGFTSLNMAQGRLRTNEVMKRIGGLITMQARATDLASRVRADDFAILMPATDASGAFSAAQRLRRVLADFSSPGSETHVTASFGVAFLPDAQLYSCASMVRRCRHAVMAAKAEGGDTVIVG